MVAEEMFMQRAFELAELGRGAVSPNPMVGCVLVSEGSIIGEGWHRNYGKGHAEVEAVKDAVGKGFGGRLAGATAYVTLEPCSHTGKTPPCADLLVAQQIGKVVIANKDPNPLVEGRGIRRLRDAGVEVICGWMEEEGKRLNERFFLGISEQRPWVILKWAQSADGFLSKEGERTKISNALTDLLVHQWRSEEDALMVGKGTVCIDNPKLNVRHWAGRNPVRVVMDRTLATATDLYHVFDGTQPTIFVNTIRESLYQESLSRYLVPESGTYPPNYLKVPRNDEDIATMLAKLYQMGVGSVMVEGGAGILHAFLKTGLWDEIRLIQGQVELTSGTKAPQVNGTLRYQQRLGGDTIFYFSSPK
jgi:diaminohydroxyphosphoribosylaminopyrimidine deaminase/5-amino-6-(5-phosphoribosylamino)uracil reductase